MSSGNFAQDLGYALVGLMVGGAIIAHVFGLTILVMTLVMAWRARRQGRMRRAALWFAAGVGPLVIFAATVVVTEMRVAARTRYVANLERVRIDGDHPRVLEVHGWLAPHAAARVLGAGAFDVVHIYQGRDFDRPMRRRTVYVFDRSSACRTVAVRASRLAAAGQKPDLDDRQDFERCVKQRTETIPRPAIEPAAVVLLTERNTTLKTYMQLQRTLKASGNFEIRLRQGGQDRLIDYWEDLYYERPISPYLFGPLGYFGVPGGEAKTLDRADFILRAVGRSPREAPASGAAR